MCGRLTMIHPKAGLYQSVMRQYHFDTAKELSFLNMSDCEKTMKIPRALSVLLVEHAQEFAVFDLRRWLIAVHPSYVWTTCPLVDCSEGGVALS
jgi:hypothetical protein